MNFLPLANYLLYYMKIHSQVLFSVILYTMGKNEYFCTREKHKDEFLVGLLLQLWKAEKEKVCKRTACQCPEALQREHKGPRVKARSISSILKPFTETGRREKRKEVTSYRKRKKVFSLDKLDEELPPAVNIGNKNFSQSANISTMSVYVNL